MRHEKDKIITSLWHNKDVHRLCNETIAQFLQQPNRCFEFDIDVIEKCLQANSIYASRKGLNNILIVTHSSRSDIPIGNILAKFDFNNVDKLNNEDLIRLLQLPNRIIECSMPKDDDINFDAKQCGKQYDSFTQFCVCGVCATEYGLINLRLITEYGDNLGNYHKFINFRRIYNAL